MGKEKKPEPFFRAGWKTYTLCLVALWYCVNWVYHVWHKPAELASIFGAGAHKTPSQTWKRFRSEFRENSTSYLSPEFLAALAQAESSGNELARTYWRWKFTTDIFQIYAPASSAVGMFQITDGTAKEMGRYCIRENKVSSNCGPSWAYIRLSASHAIEMTAAYLHKTIDRILSRRSVRAGREKLEALATVIHLCGAGRGERFARKGFSARSWERCGSHRLSNYISKVKRLKSQFRAFSRRDTHGNSVASLEN